MTNFNWKTLIPITLAAVLAVGTMEVKNVMAETIDPQLAGFAAQMRSSYRAMIPMAGKPDAVAEIKSIMIPAANPDRKIPVRVYVPAGSGDADILPIVLFAHGGGFVSGDLDTHDVLTRAIANRAKALVLSIDYRLAPEHPFPAGLEDVYAVAGLERSVRN